MKIEYRIILMILVLSQVAYHVDAQKKFGNEWINPSKTYLKLKVAENGIYKLTYEEMVAAGFINTKINGTDLQLINYGTDQALYVSDNDFGPGDHIEFYGEKNTIGLDSLLYADWRKDLLNPDYSLVNDTNAYFLAISPEKNNIRYTLKNPNFGSTNLTPFPYYLHEEKLVFSSSFYKNTDGGDVRYSNLEPSEGFNGGSQQTSTLNFNASNVIEQGPQPILNIRTGLNGNYAKLEISWNGQIIDTKVSDPRKTLQLSYTLDKTTLKSSNVLNIKNVQSTTDRHFLATSSLIFPRSFDFNNSTSYNFTMTSSSSQRLIEISNFKNTGDVAVLYDPTNKIRYSTKQSGNKLQAIIDGSSRSTTYYLTNATDGIKVVPSLTKFKPQKFENDGQQYVIISHKALYATGPNYVQEYADYRSSQIGGGYKTNIVDIQDIYDHFGYGIDRHFQGVKQFAAFMKENWSETKFVFLIGKGLEYPYIRTTNDVENYKDNVFFIPTYGYPGSDNMLFSEGNYPDPYFALGRLAAKSSDDIKNYLNKIKQYDQAPFAHQTIEDKLWMKKAIHLGGGTTPYEKDSFKGILKNMENIIRNSKLGFDVSSYYKSSTDILQSVTTEKIRDEINNGVSLITFFGHSAAGTWEFSLENPRDYSNFGKYPFINSLGCYSGNIHGKNSGISEFFVLEKDKGSIAFLASTSTAFPLDLSNFGQEQYNEIGNTSYNEPMGLILNKIAFKNKYSENTRLAFYQQMTFHGDPAVKIFGAEGPDYTFNIENTSISPQFINSSVTTFDIKFNIINLGKFIKDSIDIRFFHGLPNGTIVDTIYLRIEAPAISSTHEITFENKGIAGIGKNIIFGEIDYNNKITELPTLEAEGNNILKDELKDGFEFYILDDTAFPIYPKNFGILVNSNESLKSSTSNAILNKQTYILQIDTTLNFNSSIKVEEKITSSGGIIEWKPNINYTPNSVYYWRIKPDTILTINNDLLWQNSSFVYLPEKTEGWNHSHYYQYLNNNKFGLININENRVFEFPFLERTLRIVNGIYVPGQIGYGVNLDDFAGSIRPWTFSPEGSVAVAIANPETGLHIGNSNGQYGSINTTETGGNYCFAFKTQTAADRLNLMNFLENNIPDGYYTSIFTVLTSINNDLKTREWAADSLLYGKNLFSVLEKLGSTKCRLLESNGTVPYNFMVVYNKEVKAESCAFAKDEIIQTKMFVPIKENKGILKTLVVGPALKWHNFEFKINNTQISDTTSVNIIGIRDNKTEKTLINNSNLQNINLLGIDTDSFPYLRVEIIVSDKVNKSVPQFEYIRVFYDGYQEIALDPNSFLINNMDKVDQGDHFEIGICVRNLSNAVTDSIDFKFSMINKSNNQENLVTRTYKMINALDTIHVNFNKILLESPGEYNFVGEANYNKRFRENYYFNNILKKSFEIKGDKSNPLLDIYFDGVHIMDGDIVSPKPEILVTLKDDNNLLPITDPTLFEVKLDTGRNQIQEIPMSSPQIKFIPASSTNNEAKIMYYPTLKEGEYTLYVQGKDATGNKSGVNPMSVKFKVIEKQSVSNVLNYPNPFSTSTQFIFTLTGEELPDIMSISILTLTGKVVKEITKDQLGPLRIGVNRTEYKWDGTDEFGAKLANGVYLYKVNVRKGNGNIFDNYGLGKIDSSFKDGYGKMVILR
jgi:hypothetical protein